VEGTGTGLAGWGGYGVISIPVQVSNPNQYQVYEFEHDIYMTTVLLEVAWVRHSNTVSQHRSAGDGLLKFEKV